MGQKATTENLKVEKEELRDPQASATEVLVVNEENLEAFKNLTEKKGPRDPWASVTEVPAVNGEIFEDAEEEAAHAKSEEQEDPEANLAEEKATHGAEEAVDTKANLAEEEELRDL